ncbi:MAG: GAF domain-containing protein [Myxococcales bacterium]|nr:GAF domain-containing protein [Myxococcales bacterium]
MSLKKRPDGSYPAPLPADEAERLRALQEFQILDSMPERAFDDIAFLASHICRTPIALISLIDADRQWFKARVGLGVPQTSRDLAFCAHAILEPEHVLQVADATRDERFDTNPLVTGDPDIRFYAGAPLVTGDGRAIGTLCAIDRKPRELDADQTRALKALSREVMTQLELRRTILGLERALADASAARLAGDGAHAARTEVEDRMRAILNRMQQHQRRCAP